MMKKIAVILCLCALAACDAQKESSSGNNTGVNPQTDANPRTNGAAQEKSVAPDQKRPPTTLQKKDQVRYDE